MNLNFLLKGLISTILLLTFSNIIPLANSGDVIPPKSILNLEFSIPKVIPLGDNDRIWGIESRYGKKYSNTEYFFINAGYFQYDTNNAKSVDYLVSVGTSIFEMSSTDKSLAWHSGGGLGVIYKDQKSYTNKDGVLIEKKNKTKPLIDFWTGTSTRIPFTKIDNTRLHLTFKLRWDFDETPYVGFSFGISQLF